MNDTTPPPATQQEINDLVDSVEYAVEILRIIASRAEKWPAHKVSAELEALADKLLSSASHAYLATGPHKENGK